VSKARVENCLSGVGLQPQLGASAQHHTSCHRLSQASGTTTKWHHQSQDPEGRPFLTHYRLLAESKSASGGRSLTREDMPKIQSRLITLCRRTHLIHNVVVGLARQACHVETAVQRVAPQRHVVGPNINHTRQHLQDDIHPHASWSAPAEAYMVSHVVSCCVHNTSTRAARCTMHPLWEVSGSSIRVFPVISKVGLLRPKQRSPSFPAAAFAASGPGEVVAGHGAVYGRAQQRCSGEPSPHLGGIEASSCHIQVQLAHWYAETIDAEVAKAQDAGAICRTGGAGMNSSTILAGHLGTS